MEIYIRSCFSLLFIRAGNADAEIPGRKLIFVIFSSWQKLATSSYGEDKPSIPRENKVYRTVACSQLVKYATAIPM